MRHRRAVLIAVATSALLLLAAVLAHQWALHRLRDRIQQGLGPGTQVGSVEIGLAHVAVHDLRVPAAAGWPADDLLRAARVVAVPELRSLLGGAWRFHSVQVEGGYLSMLRDAKGGLQVPIGPHRIRSRERGWLAPEQLHIGELRLSGTTVDFFDAGIRKTPHRVRIERLDAVLRALELPALDAPVALEAAGLLKGPQRDGRLSLNGWFTPAARDAQLALRLAGADLVALQPYLLKVNEGGVRRGMLDLALDASVRQNRLQAPGRLTLTGLELGDGGGVLGTFAGVPRQAVLAGMSRNGRIEIDFSLEGRLDDPRFSVNENFSTRVALGLARVLGVSLGGVVEGVGNVIKGLLGR